MRADGRYVRTDGCVGKAPKAMYEMMIRIMFEIFIAPAMYVASEAVQSAYSSSRTIAIGIDSGKDMFYCMPIYDGSALHQPSL